ncbi:conserved hypothetical protein [Trichinella spiralis]|uniref:hypothetical protein n=1 Tax=Trichinella spiralis TaxID=6334 RepID=UPI0001EFE46D|nr:conserved hypothetical protein [Trichinella spiralis]XP_003370161.1 conserved hypothetical protein [Trichinella spiralis]
MPSESESFRHVLPDEGDCGPGVQQAIHHHVVSVWPISASTGGLESFPGGASHDQKTLVGAILSIPSSRADEGADDAPGDIRPRHRVDLLGILSPYARSPDIESRLPWFAPCLSSWTGPPSGTSHTLPPYAPHHRTGSPWRRPLPTPPQLI